jgi:hypothetical protein
MVSACYPPGPSLLFATVMLAACRSSATSDAGTRPDHGALSVRDDGTDRRRTMPSHDLETVLAWRGSTVRDRDGDKIGTLKELYLDRDDHPTWAAVDTGLFGLRQTFIPLADATPLDDDVQVPYDKDRVKDAPSIEPDAQLTEDEERRLYRHYGMESPDAGGEDRPTPDEAPAPVGDDADGGDDRDAMTRSEEELVVGTRRRVRGKARLKKYVVTEHVQRTIPVQREEVRVEYEPAESGAQPEDDTPQRRG